MNRPDLASQAQAAELPGAPLLDPVPDPSLLARAVRPVVPARGSRSPPR
jgi:hypothetical protein